MNHRSISTFRKLRPNASRFQSDLPTERSCKKRSTVFNDPCEAERRIRNSTRRRGESSIDKENWQECATRRPMDDETKRLLQNTAICLRSRKGRLSANRRHVASEGGKQTNRSRRKGGQHTLKALYLLRRSCVAMPLSTRCLADHPPAGGVCLAHRPLSLKTCGQKVKTPLILHKISGVFFAPAQLGGKVCAARGRSSALVRAIARATLTRGAQQTVLPQFCRTKSENRDFSC